MSKAENTYNPYREGADVWDVELGQGTVGGTTVKGLVHVYFKGYGTKHYTTEGRRIAGGAKMLYTKPVKIVEITN